MNRHVSREILDDHGDCSTTQLATTRGPVALDAKSHASVEPRRIDPAHAQGDVLRTTGLFKSFRKGPVEVPVLRGVDMSVRRGELLAIIGQSGSGKSTLLHLLGTLDAPDEGEVHFEGRRIDNLSSAQRDLLRNRRFGMIFQFYHLLPELNVLENVLTPLMITESVLGYLLRRRHHRRRATELLELLGLDHRLTHKPRELSGGEMQRTAIARALVTNPDLLLADEPTGNLDHETGREILEVLRALNREQNLTIVMVTHDQSIADQADRVVRLVDGQVQNA
ncbi:MAG TPA: ABC transporter ATP-binding protein [Planctomycetaceae bacterium]|nr:ABC transporter ATP-binding protein [Planctomycetaceae bacterium]